MKKNSPAILRSYARALLDQAVEAKQVEVVSQVLSGLQQLMETSPMGEVLLNPVIPDHEKKGVLLRTLEKWHAKIPYLERFLELLVEKRRVSLLRELRYCFDGLALARNLVSRATVSSALPMDTENLDQLRKVLEERLGRAVKLETKQDPDLLMGAVVLVDDQVLDLSARGQLQKMKSYLISEER